MAQRENIGWLGRVPIDTKLVRLLDDVVKGAVENVTPAQDGEAVYVATHPEDAAVETDPESPPRPVQDASDGLRKLDVSEQNGDPDETSAPSDKSKTPFPLLDLYMETTSSKVWKDITDGVLKEIRQRGEAAANSVQ